MAVFSVFLVYTSHNTTFTHTTLPGKSHYHALTKHALYTL